uniref:Chromosome 1 open reading frame 74 n=1 Tax=Iconisemion striatum TaxID=60296 RepID=A0A1A7WTB8_9TELE
MSVRELYVAVAHKYLSVGRKSLSVPQSLDLAAQVLAVEAGLKPALLYDSNGASAAQVQQYLSSLQSLHLVSESLLTLDLNGNSLIVNTGAVRSNLERVLYEDNVAVIDVRHSLDKPAVSSLQRGEMKSVIEDLLLLLERRKEAEKHLCVGEKYEEWNLCTVFGVLLGFPITYWFDQTESFENCLSMTPLMVITASVSWQADGPNHRCCLYSFSLPAALQEETRSKMEDWELHLRERFKQQHILKDLSISQAVVSLQSVCL